MPLQECQEHNEISVRRKGQLKYSWIRAIHPRLDRFAAVGLDHSYSFKDKERKMGTEEIQISS